MIVRGRAAAGRGLEEHIAKWRLSLEAANDTPEYIKEAAAKLGKVISFCGWNRLSDIAADGLERWKLAAKAQGKALATINRHIRTVKTFCGWLVKAGLVTENPVRHVGMLNAETDRRRERRALTPEEIGRLLTAAESGRKHHGLTGHVRALLYRLALSTGLRWNECRTLVRANFDFDGQTPSVTVKALNAKNGHTATLPLLPDLAADLNGSSVLYRYAFLT